MKDSLKGKGSKSGGGMEVGGDNERSVGGCVGGCGIYR